MKQEHADWDKMFLGADITSIPFPSSLSEQFMGIVKDIFPLGSSFIEVGCGSGEIAAYLARNGYRTALVDRAHGALVLSKKFFARHGVKGEFINGDLFNIPCGDKSFDCAWNSGVMEHFTDKELIDGLRELKRVSRRKVITMIPNSWCIPYRLSKLYMEVIGTWEYGREIPRPSLAYAFEEAGFSDIREDYIQVYWGIQWLDQLGDCGKFLGERIYGHYVKNPKKWEGGKLRKKFLGYLLLTIGKV